MMKMRQALLKTIGTAAAILTIGGVWATQVRA